MHERIEWASNHMSVLGALRKDLKKNGFLKNKKISMALHVEAKTAVLAITLASAGAEIAITSCNPLTTDPPVASSLSKVKGIKCYARKFESSGEYYEALHKVLDIGPDILIDDGADLIKLVHTERRELLDGVIGANEETTTGVIRLRAMEKAGVLRFPVFDVNDARMKHLFDNRYGTGQSTFDGIFSATNLLIAGKTVVVAGYGWCGRGIAMRARGLGADVIVTEVNPVKAIEARMDGFRVMPVGKAVEVADFVITATGCRDVVSAKQLLRAKDGVVLANAGHFDVEIPKAEIERLAVKKRRVRDHTVEYLLPNRKRIYLLADGRLVNLVAGQGHPVEIMDMSFAIQALCAQHLAANGKKLSQGVYPVPEEIDERVATLKLKELGIEIDHLTEGQKKYLASWEEGT
ncbi:MAG: adenosylhomocysteinase [Thermoplasmata archaeon]|nr:adenosylhomocysteinase [Thermoplasmata archaeon]